MSAQPHFTQLSDRAVVELSGPDWRSFLQGLLSQDVETLADGELRFGALLSPQGRLLFDLFILGAGETCMLDCSAGRVEMLVDRLALYRLRANVSFGSADTSVAALWGGARPAADWRQDPRLPALGFRGYGVLIPPEAGAVTIEAYDSHRMALGVPGPSDWGFDRCYPIEADFDLLNGIDFKKGCFVGQETTSRMKRRGAVKTRMAKVVCDGDALETGTELLAGNLRAGVVHSNRAGMAIASLRLDRLEAGALHTAGGHPWRPALPDWLAVDSSSQAVQRSQGHS